MWDLEKFADSPAFTSDTQNITYQEVAKFSEDMKKATSERGLVFSFCENSAGSALGYVSFLRNHIVPLLLDSRSDRELVDRLLKIYQPGWLWLPEKMAANFPFPSIFSGHGYMLLECGESPRLFPDLALLMLTSGSTGSPKLVRQSYKNLFANASSIAEYLKLDETEKPITTLPMSYVYGLSIINSHLLVGGNILLSPHSIMRREFWDFFNRHGATSFGGVPYTYEMLLKLKFFDRELPTLKTMTQAGGKLHPGTHEKFAKYARNTGRNFVVMYGQAEATSRMGWLPPEMAMDKPGCMGVPIPGGKFILEDESEAVIKEPGKIGELVYEGPNVALGYAEQKGHLTRGDEFRGRLHTGDMASFDEDGIFSIVGRKKRFLKVFGNRVSLDELERLIITHFPEIECALSGVDDNVRIFLNARERTENVKQFVATKTGLHPSAFKAAFIAELPKNEAGKILYSELEKLDA